jgi:UDP-N-acetylmuramoyl-L-alanyl-D-glutamate--2,6-diaminopimelate ligase
VHRKHAAADEKVSDGGSADLASAARRRYTPSDFRPEAAIRLSELAGALGLPLHGADVEVSGIAVDSRHVQPGDLFVAQRGERADGVRFVPEARTRGAVAVCSAAPVADLPTLVASDPRGAVPRLAATLYRHPASQLRLVGITGTLGKTSTALLVQSALAASGVRVGVIGSLGVRHRGRVADTGMTTPDAPSIHRALRDMVDARVTTAVIEVTSHGIALKRVAGLTFEVGALTNLVPDEHLDFHGTPEHYLRTKARFFDMLQPGAPLVVNRDDAQVRNLVGDAGLSRIRPVISVSAEGDPEADVAVSARRSDAAGSVFALEIRRALPRGDGDLAPCVIPLVLPVLGIHQVANAALAAVVALLAGGAPAGITESVAEQAPIRRRMEVVRRSAPTILDDTVGNPRAVEAVFATIRDIPHQTLRIAFGIRGSRGSAINRRLAAALGRAVRSARRPVQLVITGSEDCAGTRDRVRDEEREAFVAALRQEGVAFSYEATLAAAVRRVLEGTDEEDLVLLLGAQGMDGAAELARASLPA